MSKDLRQVKIRVRWRSAYVANVVGQPGIRASCTSGSLFAVKRCAEKFFGDSPFQLKQLPERDGNGSLYLPGDAHYWLVTELPPGGKSTQETP